MMTRLEFHEFIKSLGFKLNGVYGGYIYKEYKIDLYGYHYDFYNGSEWVFSIPLNDLTPLVKEFKKELRSIKLINILG